MFEVTVEHTFAAAHYLRDYKGKCERLHGHNYKIFVTMRGAQLDKAGMLVDFTELKRALQAVTEPFDHRFLNELAPFDTLNPSAENMARFFAEKLMDELKVEVPVEVAEVRVYETEKQSAVYKPASSLILASK